MARVFDGTLYVHYGQAYVRAMDDVIDDLEESFAGQEGGLCGSACVNTLFLITGLHTGSVNFNLEVFAKPPQLDYSWDEIVEVPFTLTNPPVAIYDWNGNLLVEVPLSTGEYRARLLLIQSLSKQQTLLHTGTVMQKG